MTSESISNAVIVDKDGFSPSSEKSDSMINRSSVISHACSIFLREEFIVEDKVSSIRYVVPAEMAPGVQLRVSSLVLFRMVVKAHSNTFFASWSPL